MQIGQFVGFLLVAEGFEDSSSDRSRVVGFEVRVGDEGFGRSLGRRFCEGEHLESGSVEGDQVPFDEHSAPKSCQSVSAAVGRGCFLGLASCARPNHGARIPEVYKVSDER